MDIDLCFIIKKYLDYSLYFKVMASILNTVLNGTANILPPSWPNNWEDVNEWSSAVITIKLGTGITGGNLQLQWANTARSTFPNVADFNVVDNDVIAVENINIVDSGTFERDHRGGWFRIKLDQTGTTTNGTSMCVIYKQQSGCIKICDDARLTSIAGATSGNYAFRTVYSDASGLILKNTGSATGNALNTTLRDNTGTSMSFTADGRSLITAISDASGLVISNANHTAFGTMSNSAGVSQATTGTLNGTSTAGVANFLALSDGVGSTVTSFRTAEKTNFTGNSVYTTLCSADGSINSATNPLYVDISADPMEGVRAFDMSLGLTTRFTTVTQFRDHALNLFNIYIYNDGPTTAWVKLYDVPSSKATGFGTTEIVSFTPIVGNLNTGSFPLDEAFIGTRTSPIRQVQLDGSTSSSATLTYTLGLPSSAGSTQIVLRFTVYTNGMPNGGYWLAYSTTDTTFQNPLPLTVGKALFTPDNTPKGNLYTNRLLFVDVIGTGILQGVSTVIKQRAFSLSDGDNLIGDGFLNNQTFNFYYDVTSPLLAWTQDNLGNFTSLMYLSDLILTDPGDGYTTGQAIVDTGLLSTQNFAVTFNINITARSGTDPSPDVFQNIACPSKSFREVVYPRGLQLINGLHFRCTLQPNYTSTMGPRRNQVFVSGTYINYVV